MSLCETRHVGHMISRHPKTRGPTMHFKVIVINQPTKVLPLRMQKGIPANSVQWQYMRNREWVAEAVYGLGKVVLLDDRF